jgi:hypothetical protein
MKTGRSASVYNNKARFKPVATMHSHAKCGNEIVCNDMNSPHPQNRYNQLFLLLFIFIVEA